MKVGAALLTLLLRLTGAVRWALAIPVIRFCSKIASACSAVKAADFINLLHFCTNKLPAENQKTSAPYYSRAHLSVGDEIGTALVEDGDVAHGGGQVLHQPRVRVHSGGHVLVEDSLDEPRELHRVRCYHSPGDEIGQKLRRSSQLLTSCSPGGGWGWWPGATAHRRPPPSGCSWPGRAP